MSKRVLKISGLFLLLVLLTVKCTDRFAEMNKDPREVNDPDLSHLFTNALYNSASEGNEYTQWFYNNSVYFWRFCQLTASRSGNASDFNDVGALGSVPVYQVLRDMKEIRYRISLMDASTRSAYKAFEALTYIPVIQISLRHTDWYGSMAYTQASEARYTGNLTPKYDSQQELFQTWLVELKDAIDVFVNAGSDQVRPGNQDFLYQSDWIKWARYANSLRLRIAARLEHADPTWMNTVLADIISYKGSDGKPLLILDPSQNAIWTAGAAYPGPGGDNSLWIENYGPSMNFSDFMRRNEDPRLRILFRKNDLSDANLALLLEVMDEEDLPAWVNIPVVEPWDRLIGSPVSPDRSGEIDYYGPVLRDAANRTYARLPYVDYNLIKPKQNNRTGEYRNILIGAAEVNLYLAEFIEKGYITGIGTAQDYYNKGVEYSLKQYDYRASAAQIVDYAERTVQAGDLAALMAQDDIRYIEGDKSGNVEKIILQQIINLFDNPYEGVAVARRTGYPKKTSTIWAWEPYNKPGGIEMKLPRRFPWNKPSDETNLANWQKALTEQGFTANVFEGTILNSQRVWWDKNCPDYGSGQ